jgi:hypothetical protein
MPREPSSACRGGGVCARGTMCAVAPEENTATGGTASFGKGVTSSTWARENHQSRSVPGVGTASKCLSRCRGSGDRGAGGPTGWAPAEKRRKWLIHSRFFRKSWRRSDSFFQKMSQSAGEMRQHRGRMRQGSTGITRFAEEMGEFSCGLRPSRGQSTYLDRAGLV